MFFRNLKKNHTLDESAPLYYSERSIWIFSTVFTVIFGAILLAINLKDSTRRLIVIGFGILYTAVSIYLLNLVPRNTSLTIVSNMIGAIILTNVFWNKYIGEQTQYRSKPIWIPLIISILITIPFILALIYFS